MKKLLFISMFAALLLAGCKKEKIYEGDDFPPTEQVPGDDDGDNQDDEDDDDGDDNNGDNPDDEDDDDGDDNNGENPDDEDDDNKGIPDDEIWYTSSVGNIVEPYQANFGGAEILSNTYEDGKGVIKFNAPVTEIGKNAFYQCRTLTSIAIPDSVTRIEESAFAYCANLTSFTIPDRVTEIGDYAFNYCRMTSVTIPDSVTRIGNNPFENIYYLAAFYGKFASEDNRCLIVDGVLISFAPAGTKEYAIPDGVTEIGQNAFSGCSGLTSITIPDSVTKIGDHAFNHCNGLTSIYIPDSVTTIGRQAFQNCIYLTNVNIGNSVTEIGTLAFSSTGLTSIYIPDSVTTIENNPFEYCYGLTAFYGKFASEDNRCLIVDGVLNSFAQAGLTEYTIPDSVTEIGEYAFAWCTGLTSIYIPDSVTEIGNYAFQYCTGLTCATIGNSVTKIGAYAFANCTSLTNVYCRATTPPYMHIYSNGNHVFANCDLTAIYVPRESVEAYKATQYWGEYENLIQPYDF